MCLSENVLQVRVQDVAHVNFEEYRTGLDATIDSHLKRLMGVAGKCTPAHPFAALAAGDI